MLRFSTLYFFDKTHPVKKIDICVSKLDKKAYIYSSFIESLRI